MWFNEGILPRGIRWNSKIRHEIKMKDNNLSKKKENGMQKTDTTEIVKIFVWRRILTDEGYRR